MFLFQDFTKSFTILELPNNFAILTTSIGFNLSVLEWTLNPDKSQHLEQCDELPGFARRWEFVNPVISLNLSLDELQTQTKYERQSLLMIWMQIWFDQRLYELQKKENCTISELLP